MWYKGKIYFNFLEILNLSRQNHEIMKNGCLGVIHVATEVVICKIKPFLVDIFPIAINLVVRKTALRVQSRNYDIALLSHRLKVGQFWSPYYEQMKTTGASVYYRLHYGYIWTDSAGTNFNIKKISHLFILYRLRRATVIHELWMTGNTLPCDLKIHRPLYRLYRGDSVYIF